jgi:hypothetical protein
MLMAALVFLSAPAFAQQMSDTSQLLTDGKIAAVEQDEVDQVHAIINQMLQVQDQVGTADDITTARNSDAESLSPSQHLLSDIGQQVDVAEMQLQDMTSKNNFDGISALKATLQSQLTADQAALNILLMN